VPRTTDDPFQKLLASILKFRDDREWKQFHTIRNLINALSIEVSELQELLLWKSDDEVLAISKSDEFLAEIARETADVMIYSLLLADAAGIDLNEAIQKKLAENAAKYPIELAKGSSAKYTALRGPMAINRVALQPAAGAEAKQHFKDTIENAVPLKRVESHLSNSELADLKASCDTTNLRIWGVTPGARGQNRTRWSKLTIDDDVLFTGNNKAFLKGKVCFKCRSGSLANDLWGQDADGDTWEYVYFVSALTACDIPYAKINAAAGFAANYIPRGFTILDANASIAVRKLLAPRV
jgi:NTP pyrophosphatase (non-canonical NTP hydrolase)